MCYIVIRRPSLSLSHTHTHTHTHSFSRYIEIQWWTLFPKSPILMTPKGHPFDPLPSPHTHTHTHTHTRTSHLVKMAVAHVCRFLTMKKGQKQSVEKLVIKTDIFDAKSSNMVNIFIQIYPLCP